MSKSDIVKALLGHMPPASSTHKEVVKVVPQVRNLDVRTPPKPKPESKTALEEEDLIGPLPLGYDKGMYYYLSRKTLQVHDLPTGQHGPNALLSMAPLSYWMMRFKGTKGPDWHGATDFLMASCHKMGVYNPELARGRGVAFDKGRVVLHLGSRLIVNGIPQNSLILDDSQYIYEQSRVLPVDLGEPLSDEEAYKIIEICTMFSWYTPDMALLFAGWLVTAPVCGGLPWRTHLWLTGEKGSGKSWVMSHFVKPIIGPIGFYIQSKTTEAGIRQHLRIDARPVIFDESETANDSDRSRIQQIMDLARQSSSDEGFQILKGTVNGKDMRFKIHSSFLFSSINFGAIQAADESRIIPVMLTPMPFGPQAAERFDKIKSAVSNTLTPEFSGRLLARTLKLLPVIRANIAIFSRALSETMPSRQADTIGAIVAGVYSLFASKTLTYEEAKDFVRDKKWIQIAVSRTEIDADHTKALSHLLEQVIRLSPSSEMSIAEATRLAWEQPEHDICRMLSRHGLRVKDNALYIARSHYILDKMYVGTPWAKVWDRILLQVPGAIAGHVTTDFAGYKKKPVVIPLVDLFGQ